MAWLGVAVIAAAIVVGFAMGGTVLDMAVGVVLGGGVGSYLGIRVVRRLRRRQIEEQRIAEIGSSIERWEVR